MLTIAAALVAVLTSVWCFGRALGGRADLLVASSSIGWAASSEPLDVSIVIPARDEAASLPVLLDSLGAGARPAEIIVVDDGSTDDTASVAVERGAQVIAAPPLPAGWTGKNWACHLGATHACGERLLFLDADTQLAPGALESLLATHDATGRGLLSVQPFHRTGTAIEDLSAIFNAVSLFGCGAFTLRPPDALRMAFGPCLLIDAEEYRRIGGHSSVRADVVEDIALAERSAAAWLPVSCRLGGRQISFRMYPAGWRSMVQGWTKNIAVGARRAPLAASLPAMVWVTALATVAAATIGGLFGWAGGGQAPVAALAAWAIVAADLFVVLRRIGTFRIAAAALFVVPLAFFLTIFLRSAVLVGRGATATWRGREVPVR